MPKKIQIKPTKIQGFRWEHFGCPKCGAIHMLPFERDEKDPPWCVCPNANYSWSDPHPETQNGPLPWTKMVKVDVYVRG